jgi:pyruvate/2-oxoglutarate dehydrogenase complex dihydrolipoamide dehydrogenase (E3) component
MNRTLTPDLCVIGAGAGGLAVAAAAAQLGAAVVLVEQGAMGGDCLNSGCVPSKSMIAAARLAHSWRHAAAFGICCQPPRIDFAAVAESIARVIDRLAPNDSVERFRSLGVTVLPGTGRFTGPRTLRADDAEIRPRRFVIATGSHPAVPRIPGLVELPYLTNETVFHNRALPEHLIVIGGGPVGIEMAQAHRRLGARVTVLDQGPLLPRDDPELVGLLSQQLAREGIVLRPGVAIASASNAAPGLVVSLADGERINGSHLLIAAGRTPNTEELDLAAGGISVNDKGNIIVDDRLRTTNRRAFAIGDVAGGPQFTHVASYHAGIVIRNALFRLPAKVDYRALSWVTYTDPELAHAGIDERAARQRFGDRMRVMRWPFAENDRAHTERDTAGLVKLVTRRDGRILGAAILAAGAGELILPWVLAIAQKLKIGAFANLVVPYPTRGEAGKRAAGNFYTSRLFSPHTRQMVRFLAHFG